MKLSDFYYEAEAEKGTRMPIPLKDGTDSGEWLNVVSPEADVAVRAMRAFILAYRTAAGRLKPLRDKCEELKDFSEYNLKLEDAAGELNRQLALELVNGWSLDDEFTKENLETLLTQYKRLAEHVVVFHHEQLRQLQEK
ncbi:MULTISPECIES: phage tail assembly chaperone [Gammaproteobacteria]|uniref:Tail assembly chaperone n=3 Tax=root TaxID=1 RepID=A0A619DV55_SALDU|nr:tail assembly chaperone [Salmonella phage FSL SP-101]EAA8503674.1 hypothetical protein [Salmonella enterica]EAY2243366.1 hypothetical protein [Salmonella enterica subsp. enterica serovar Dublin]ECC3990644.1 hypothetical protein [Salmonella enterica subsp. enterica]AGF87725.1 hypothetical protein SP101_00110 [Salmonella phage FSL SP-101]EAP0865553.1 hypothetical protein [Salmonella enterica]